MKEILTFASENPWLTFFIVAMILQTLAYIVHSICNRNSKNDDDDDLGG